MWIRTNQDQSQTESRHATWTHLKKIENSLPEMKYTIQLTSEKEVSSWLNALPLSKHGFGLTKTEFRDGIAICYTWEAKNTPAICPYGIEFSLTQALHCAKGVWRGRRHLMDDVCHDVQIAKISVAISFVRYETNRNQDQRKTRRAVRRHYKLHPNENQLRTSEELCSLLEGMSCPQASCSQWDFD